MKARKSKCIDPDVSSKLLAKVNMSMVAGNGFFVTPEEGKHLENCGFCREYIPTFFEKSGSAQKTGTAFGIVERGESGDPGVIVKSTKVGKAFFQSHDQDQSKGLMVVVREGTVFHPKEMTLEEFYRLE